ncbi:MAG: DUF3109 family protein [Odoribacter sp.]|nr:DUF3109 family protein [Bacteroidales bacterium]MBR2980711.1 DUF3109 family protein [Odoribacter sp.]
MIQIEDSIVTFDLFEKHFSCDLAQCKGACCIEGDGGAPLDEEELKQIEDNYDSIKKYMKPAGITSVAECGFGEVDKDGDLVTPLINGVECAYAIDEGGSCWCAIEKAWAAGESSFRKPISCHLYPVRIKRYDSFEAVNVHKWSICKCAFKKGEREQMPLYKFLKDALIRKYGEEWYEMLCVAASEIESGAIDTSRL